MKRLGFIAVIGVLAALTLLGFTGVASANFGIHGGYLVDTDACAGCHRAHTATSGITWTDADGGVRSGLLISTATLIYEFCYTCHGSGAQGAATDVQGGVFDSVPSYGTNVEAVVGWSLNGGGFERIDGLIDGRPDSQAAISRGAVTSTHEIGSTSWNAWGEGLNGPGAQVKMDCASCHDVHGSSNYRILMDQITINGKTKKVGGYGNFATAVDPDPEPFVISNEVGYPNGWDDPALPGIDDGLGFRLHAVYDGATTNYNGKMYEQYKPDYTTARYALPPGADYRKGISGWCTACHEQYGFLGKTGTEYKYQKPDYTWASVTGNTRLTVAASAGDTVITVADASGLTVGDEIQIGFDFTIGPGLLQRAEKATISAINAATNQVTLSAGLLEDHAVDTPVYDSYDAGDGYGTVVRHRHPVNVPLSNWYKNGVESDGPRGDRALVYRPELWYQSFGTPGFDSTDPKYVDIPLEHDAQNHADGDGEGSNQVNNVNGVGGGPGDWLGCLTCHRAHGTTATMQGYANVWDSRNPLPDSGIGGVDPTNDSALLRANNRGVCERCHNK